MRQTKETHTKTVLKLGFGQGFCLGLGSLALLAVPNYIPPRIDGNGLASDWRAVGRDIRTAMRRADEFGKAG